MPNRFRIGYANRELLPVADRQRLEWVAHAGDFYITARHASPTQPTAYAPVIRATGLRQPERGSARGGSGAGGRGGRPYRALTARVPTIRDLLYYRRLPSCPPCLQRGRGLAASFSDPPPGSPASRIRDAQPSDSTSAMASSNLRLNALLCGRIWIQTRQARLEATHLCLQTSRFPLGLVAFLFLPLPFLLRLVALR